jgi:putative photosynthetic complex assembly protein 2
MITPNLWLGVGVTVFAWWFSTGLILLLLRAPRALHGKALIVFGVVACIALWGLSISAQTLSPPAVYCGFICALLIWGWHEASFLMGIVTGPRPQPCPPDAKGWRRFGYATATLIYHEIALFVTLLAIAVLAWNAPNQTGFWTFGVLFVMRLSSKFNIFLGVPNLTEAFFPDHLKHLKSYLPKRKMNVLMPFSIAGCATAIYWQWQLLTRQGIDDARALALVIVLTLTILGMLEHIFMITPLPDALLWQWATGNKSTRQSAPSIEQKNNDNA